MSLFLEELWHRIKEVLGKIFTWKKLFQVWSSLLFIGLLGFVLPFLAICWAITGAVSVEAVRITIAIVFFLSATFVMGPLLRLAGFKNARLAWIGSGVLLVIFLLLSTLAHQYLVAPYDRVATIGLAVLLLLIGFGGGRRTLLKFHLIPWALIIIGVAGGIYSNPQTPRIKFPHWGGSSAEVSTTKTVPVGCEWKILRKIPLTLADKEFSPEVKISSTWDEKEERRADTLWGKGCVEVILNRDYERTGTECVDNDTMPPITPSKFIRLRGIGDAELTLRIWTRPYECAGIEDPSPPSAPAPVQPPAQPQGRADDNVLAGTSSV